MILVGFAKWHSLTITTTPSGGDSIPMGYGASIIVIGERRLFCVRVSGRKRNWRNLRARLVRAGLEIESNHDWESPLSFNPEGMRQVGIILAVRKADGIWRMIEHRQARATGIRNGRVQTE